MFRQLMFAVIILLTTMMSPLFAAGMGGTNEDLAKTTESAGKVADDWGIVVVPIPQSSPALGNGLTLAGALFYTPSTGDHPWVTGMGTLYTDSDSWAAGALQKAHLLDDKVRITAIAGYASLNLDFFGIGSAFGDRDVSIPIRQQGDALLLKGLGEVIPGLFLGARYRLLSLKTTVRTFDIPPQSGLSLPDAELDNVTSGIGLIAEYDTRDNEFYPQRGTFAKLDTNFARQALGSSFDYWQLDVAYNRYLSLTESSVLAVRGSTCVTGGSVPFYDLCLFGMNHDLRGYETGQYRDETMFAVQAEYRWRFFWRLGLAAFAGVGAVAPSVGELAKGYVLPSGGAGLRILVSRQYNVNVSADFAVGKDSTGFYVYIGEAF